VSVRLPLSCLALVFGLSACGESPPMRYYTLRSIAPAASSAASAGATAAMGGARVRLESVALPPELDRLEIVSRAGPYRVQISDFDRWAAPLEEQVRRTLSDDLAARMPTGLVVDPNEPATQEPRRLLSVAFGAFSADDNCEVAARIDWTLSIPHGDAVHGQEELQLPASMPCVGAVPGAMSTALAQLADRLATGLLRAGVLEATGQ